MRRSKDELLNRLISRYIKGEITEAVFYKRLDNDSYYTKRNFRDFIVRNVEKAKKERGNGR